MNLERSFRFRRITRLLVWAVAGWGVATTLASDIVGAGEWFQPAVAAYAGFGLLIALAFVNPLLRWAKPVLVHESAPPVRLTGLGDRSLSAAAGFAFYFLILGALGTQPQVVLASPSISRDSSGTRTIFHLPVANMGQFPAILTRLLIDFQSGSGVLCMAPPTEIIEYELLDTARLSIASTDSMLAFVGTRELAGELNPMTTSRLTVRGLSRMHCPRTRQTLEVPLHAVVAGRGGLILRLSLPRKFRGIESDSSVRRRQALVRDLQSDSTRFATYKEAWKYILRDTTQDFFGPHPWKVEIPLGGSGYGNPCVVFVTIESSRGQSRPASIVEPWYDLEPEDRAVQPDICS